MRRIASVFALGACSLSAFAQPGDRNQIDIKARIKGTTAWLDTINYSAATADTPLDVEVGVFFYRDQGVGFATCVFAATTSNWLPGDIVTLVDRPDSQRHPDGRQGNFNTGGQMQGAFTTGIDAGRLRIAAFNNTADAIGGGISVHQNIPTSVGFDTSDGVLGFRFDITIVNPLPGHATSRTMVCEAPKNRINSYGVYGSDMLEHCVLCGPTLLPTDGATIDVRWPRCSLACPTDRDCDGFATGDDIDSFVAAFVEGLIDADFDNNGFVNADDFDTYVLAFQAGC